MNLHQWTLKQEFASADIERINHPEYFYADFSCGDLEQFIGEINTASDALKYQAALNKFYDYLIDSHNQEKTLYLRLKWLAYLHKLIHQFRSKSVMYTLSLKALQIYAQNFKSTFKDHFQNYLSNKILKPYIQYLSKLCMISLNKSQQKNQSIQSTKNQQDKQNQNSQNESLQSTNYQILNKQNQSARNQNKAEQTLKWYRGYNFLIQTLQVFPPILKQQEQFFKTELPYLSNIKKYICTDLKSIFSKLKNSTVSLTQLNMTMMELNKLEQKISQFANFDNNIFHNCQSVLLTNIQDYSKEDIENFMFTPLKQNSNYINRIALNFS